MCSRRQTGVTQPWNAKDGWPPPEAGWGQEGPALEPSERERGPADLLMLDLGHPEL